MGWGVTGARADGKLASNVTKQVMGCAAGRDGRRRVTAGFRCAKLCRGCGRAAGGGACAGLGLLETVCFVRSDDVTMDFPCGRICVGGTGAAGAGSVGGWDQVV